MGKAEKQGRPRRAKRKMVRSGSGKAARKSSRGGAVTRRKRGARASASFDGVKGVCLDLDGVLYVEGAVIAGAVEATRRLAASGLAIRYVTNTTSRSRR